MQKDKTAGPPDEYDEEVHDILIAISVVAKRLATKMSENQKEKKDVQGLRTDRTDNQS